MAAGSSHHLNTGNEGLGQVLGDLEAEIMECMWDLGSASVRRVHECLQEDRNIAYTTVMTVMTRLAEKGLSLIHISEPTRRTPISYAVFCLKKKTKKPNKKK